MLKVLSGNEPGTGRFEVSEDREDFLIVMWLANGERVTRCVTRHHTERLERVWTMLRKHGFTGGAPV